MGRKVLASKVPQLPFMPPDTSPEAKHGVAHPVGRVGCAAASDEKRSATVSTTASLSDLHGVTTCLCKGSKAVTYGLRIVVVL